MKRAAPIFILSSLFSVTVVLVLLSAGSAHADQMFSEQELQSLQYVFEEPACVSSSSGCETADWVIRTIQFPSGSRGKVDPGDILFVVTGKPPEQCGAGRCVVAYVLRDARHLVALVSGLNLIGITAADIPPSDVRKKLPHIARAVTLVNRSSATSSEIENQESDTTESNSASYEFELGVFKSENLSQNDCPQKVVIKERSSWYEGGYTVDGRAELGFFAGRFTLASAEPGRVAWVAPLKSAYRRCTAISKIVKEGGEIYTSYSHLQLIFNDGKVYLILDVAGLPSPSGEPLEVLDKKVVNGNPVWMWSGAD